MKWCIPNSGSVVLILGNDNDTDKANMLLALDAASKAGQLRGDLDKFRVLLASHIELEDALAKDVA